MSPKTEQLQTASSASMIGLAAFGGAIFGFFLQLLVAFHFGAGQTTDAYFMAQSTSEMLSKLLLGGSITAVFLPMFVERIAIGQRDDAWRLGLNLLHLSAVLFFFMIILIGLFAQPFISFIAPGFDQATTDLTVSLLRVLLPSFLLLFLVEMITAMLHSLKVFSLPALLRIVAPLTSLVVVATLAPRIGIYSLALGTVIGSLLQLVIVAFGLKRQALSYRLVFSPFDPAIKKLIKLVYPFIFAVLMTQGAGIVYRILVSDLSAGSLSALKFAEKITQLITIMFINSVTIVVFPLLSAKASRHDFSGMRETIGSSMRLIAFITTPLVVGVALLREPLVAIIYQRGLFSAEDAAMTSLALLFFVIGLTTNGFSSVLGHATLALKETRASVAVTIASQAVAISLFVLLVPRLAHAGLALASSLVPLSIGLLYFLYLTRFMDRLYTIFWHTTYVKTVVLAVGLAAVVYLTIPLSDNLSANRQLALLINLLIPALAGSSVYFVGAYVWQVPEMKNATAIVLSRLQKLRA